MADKAQDLIAALGLLPHPEGGWFRETWRADSPPGIRAGGTAILFLLEGGQRSHWHRVDGDELWLWHDGHPLDLRIAATESSQPATILLGPGVLDGDRPQCLVPTGQWQSTAAPHGWALVSCIVVPGFEFAGFELAEPGWEPGG